MEKMLFSQKRFALVLLLGAALFLPLANAIDCAGNSQGNADGTLNAQDCTPSDGELSIEKTVYTMTENLKAANYLLAKTILISFLLGSVLSMLVLTFKK